MSEQRTEQTNVRAEKARERFINEALHAARLLANEWASQGDIRKAVKGLIKAARKYSPESL